MIRRNPSKKEKELQNLAQKKASQVGEGVFLFQNNTMGTLQLPKPPIGQTSNFVAKGATFKGDSYFLKLVRTNDLRFLGEDTESKMSEKLIVEQPPTITPAGTVEHLVENPKKKLVEDQKPATEEILLTEDPSGSIVIVD